MECAAPARCAGSDESGMWCSAMRILLWTTQPVRAWPRHIPRSHQALRCPAVAFAACPDSESAI
jgi:hypothetical protein